MPCCLDWLLPWPEPSQGWPVPWLQGPGRIKVIRVRVASHHARGPRRLLLWVISCHGPATLEVPPALVPLPPRQGFPLLSWLHLLPSEARRWGSHKEPLGPEGGRVERVGEAAPQGASAPSGERRGAWGPQGRREAKGPATASRPDGSGQHPAQGGSAGPPARHPQAVGSPVRGPPASLSSRLRPHRSGCGRGGCRARCHWGRSPGGSRCGSRAGDAAGYPSGGRSLWASRAAASPRSGPGARSENPGSQLRARSPETRRSRAGPSPRRQRRPPPPP